VPPCCTLYSPATVRKDKDICQYSGYRLFIATPHQQRCSLTPAALLFSHGRLD